MINYAEMEKINDIFYMGDLWDEDGGGVYINYDYFLPIPGYPGYDLHITVMQDNDGYHFSGAWLTNYDDDVDNQEIEIDEYNFKQILKSL